MKVTHHIPTESFGFTEIETEAESIQEALAQYPKDTGGLPDKEWRDFLDNLILKNGENHIEDMEQLSPKQNEIAQEVKRSIKRIMARQART